MDVKSRFVEDVSEILEEEGNRMLRRQSSAMKRQLQFHTGHLFFGRGINIESSGGKSVAMIYHHVLYERFLDMRTIRHGSKVTHQNYRIHNRFIFGTNKSIIRRLEDTLVETFRETFRM